jgi:hypothetical protein
LCEGDAANVDTVNAGLRVFEEWKLENAQEGLWLQVSAEEKLES